MEGGIITTDDEEIYHLLLSLRALAGQEISRKPIKSVVKKVIMILKNHLDLFFQDII